jgi:cytochrome P450
LFTNYPNGIPAREGGADKLIPVEIDPPEHMKYRSVLAPLFAPPALRKIEPRIRQLVIELIDGFRARGRCDFATDISMMLPTSIFVEIMGMPLEDLPQILEYEHAFLRGPDEQARKKGADDILGYLVKFLNANEGYQGKDLLGTLLNARDAEGVPWTKAEIYNSAFLLYVAGLDTVANMMSFIWYRLATDTAARQYVAANYERTNEFVDELTRLGVPAVNARRVRRDCVYRGVFMKAGDAVLNVPTLANRDPDFFPNPDEVDFSRANARQQVTFGAGPHRCLGAHLARTEIIIAIEEWFRRIPEFGLEPGAPLDAYCGNIMGFAHLPLAWET